MRVSTIVTVLSAATAGIIAVPSVLGGTYTFQNGASNDFVDSYSGTQAATVEVITGNSNDNANYGGQTVVRTQNSSGNRYRFIESFDLSSLTPYASQLTVTSASLKFTQAWQNSDSSPSPLVVNIFNTNNVGWQQGSGTSVATTTGPWATGNAYSATNPLRRWEDSSGNPISGNTISGTGAYTALFTQPTAGSYVDNAATFTSMTVPSNSTFVNTVQSWITTPSTNAGLLFGDNGGSTDIVEFFNDNYATVADRPGLALTLTSETMSTDYTDTSGDTWSDGTAWDNGSPNTIGATANFGSAISAPQTVTVDSPQVVSAINFNNSNSYTIGGDSTITLLEVNTGQATLSVASGNHSISAPINVRTDTTFNVASGSTLAITGQFTATNKTITNAGPGTVQIPSSLVVNALNAAAGTVQVQNLNATTLTLSGGTVQITPQPNAGNGGGVSVISNISATSGTLDLTNNGLIVPYTTTSPIGTIASLIHSGNITSSTTRTPYPTGVGYVDSSAVGGPSTFLGHGYGNSAVFVRYTLMGDTNLDGVVDASDFANLAADYGATVQNGWVLGDFNGDGTVNALDFNFLATNYGAPLDPPSGALPLGAVVPEPTAIGLISGVAVLLTRRRRRS